jgi:hypothetical protein
MACGFVHLVAIIDRFSRRVLAWRVSITLDVDFCVEALEEALSKFGKPDINTDQGSQFTSAAFTGVIERENIAISMDGKGCWRDNVFALLRLARIGPDEHGPGGAQPHVRDLHPHRLAGDLDVLVAPVKLAGFSRPEPKAMHRRCGNISGMNAAALSPAPLRRSLSPAPQ